MTRNQRVTLELFGPALIHFALNVVLFKGEFFLETARGGLEGVIEMLMFLGYLVLTACLTVCVPSILYALAMEWRFARGLEPRSWRSVDLSVLLGFAAGVVMSLPFFGMGSGIFFMSVYFGAQGLAVGLIMGLLIRGLSPRQPPLLVHD